MKKKRTFGVSPKGALVLREREEERRRNLPRVEITREGAAKRVTRNPLLELMEEFPTLPPINIDLVINPDVKSALDLALLTVRGADYKQPRLPYHRGYVTHPVDSYDPLKTVMDHLVTPLKTLDPQWEVNVGNMPGGAPDMSFIVEPTPSSDKLAFELIESDNRPIRNWLNAWYPGGVLVESEFTDQLRYRMRRANARSEVGPDDNNYRDFLDTIRSWYTRDAVPSERRLYTSEIKMCDSLEKLRVYFNDFKERTGTQLSGLDITIGSEVDNLNRFKLMATEVFYQDQAMLLLEVVTTAPNVRPMGFVRYFKEPGTLRARNDSERDISWTFNTFFSDFNVFGRDQLDQFLDIVVYCLDKGVREDISYYG